MLSHVAFAFSRNTQSWHFYSAYVVKSKINSAKSYLRWGLNMGSLVSFLKIFGRHLSFLWGHWYPCFGHLMTSLGFKAKVGCLIRTWQRDKKSCQIIGLSPKSRDLRHSNQSENYWISHLFRYSDKTSPTQTNIGVTDILPSVISMYLGLIIIKPFASKSLFTEISQS